MARGDTPRGRAARGGATRGRDRGVAARGGATVVGRGRGRGVPLPPQDQHPAGSQAPLGQGAAISQPAQAAAPVGAFDNAILGQVLRLLQAAFGGGQAGQAPAQAPVQSCHIPAAVAAQFEVEVGGTMTIKLVGQKRPATSQPTRGGQRPFSKSAKTRGYAAGTKLVGGVAQKANPNIICHGCRKRGHIVKQCWRLNNKCIRCGSPEHKIETCPLMKGRGPAGSGQPSASIGQGKVQTVPTVRSALIVGRSAHTQGQTQLRGALPTQSSAFRGRGGGRGLSTVVEETEPAGNIITGVISIFRISAITLLILVHLVVLYLFHLSQPGLITCALDSPVAYSTGHRQVVVTDFVRKCPVKMGE